MSDTREKEEGQINLFNISRAPAEGASALRGSAGDIDREHWSDTARQPKNTDGKSVSCSRAQQFLSYFSVPWLFLTHETAKRSDIPTGSARALLAGSWRTGSGTCHRVRVRAASLAWQETNPARSFLFSLFLKYFLKYLGLKKYIKIIIGVFFLLSKDFAFSCHPSVLLFFYKVNIQVHSCLGLMLIKPGINQAGSLRQG